MVHEYKIFDMKIVMIFLFLKMMFGGYALPLFTTVSVTTKAQTDPNSMHHNYTRDVANLQLFLNKNKFLY